MTKEILILIILVGAGVWVFNGQKEFLSIGQEYSVENIPNITAEDVQSKIDSNENIFILDVRTQGEYVGPLGHIDNSKLIPVQELGNRLSELESIKNKEIIVVCRSGNRSRTGTMILLNGGFHAVNMLGGMKAWNKIKS